MDNRKLGWIAIGLGVLALVFAVGGRGRSQGWYNYGPRFDGPMAVAPQGQAPQVGPQGQAPQAEPRGDFSPRQRFAPHDRWRGGHPGDFGPGGPRHFGGWLLLPFKIIGGLFRLALFGVLILLAVQWFRRRGRNGTQDPPNPPTPPSDDRPGPEQPPYTSGTQAL